jgi:hypothetical protein
MNEILLDVSFYGLNAISTNPIAIFLVTLH